MTDPNFYFTAAVAGLAGLGMICLAALAGWRGWLTLKAQELATFGGRREPNDGPSLPNAGARIDIADLKERIRKLEAIASGVDL
ncbi:hypothetical protein [uncultured Sphingomonas sp.]|uniref:hypothetical protein n=1 Tax=uncultured Sphingomonas sp. TaxID=158754 RepID=UPI0035CA0E6E